MTNIFTFAELSLDPFRDDTGLSLALMALMVVLAALMLVRIFMGNMPRLMAVGESCFPKTEEAPSKSASFTFASAAAPAAEKARAAASEELPEHVVAIMAAVVADTVGKNHRILRTRVLGPEELSWSMHGRLQNHISFRLK